MYLESRIRDALPQATYKRFLVSRHRPDLCDLLDDIRDNKIPSPSWFSGVLNLAGHEDHYRRIVF